MTNKAIMFYTKDAGLSSADVKRMEENGVLCVKVKDPTKITASPLGSARYLPQDRTGMLVWKAMLSSSNARDKFGQLLIAEIDNNLKVPE